MPEAEAMFQLDLDRVRDNARRATTEDLLDRVTVYRQGMEAEAVEVIEAELRTRGVTAAEQVDHERRRGAVLRDAGGLPLCCGHCGAPAVARVRTWHRLLGLLPLFPRWLPLCAEHASTNPTPWPPPLRGEEGPGGGVSPQPP